MILKSDGAALYDTTDLATLVEREELFQPNEVIYVVDKRQELHFVQVFRCAKKTGIVKEDCVSITGLIEKRDEETYNPKIATGTIELEAKTIQILGKVYKPLPFEVMTSKEIREDLRLKYRYLDLRRPDLQRNLILRSRVAAISLAAARRVATTSRAAPRPPSRRPLRRLRRTARCLALATRPSRWSWDCWLQLPQCLALLSSCASVLVARLVRVAQCPGYRRS